MSSGSSFFLFTMKRERKEGPFLDRCVSTKNESSSFAKAYFFSFEKLLSFGPTSTDGLLSCRLLPDSAAMAVPFCFVERRFCDVVVSLFS